MGGLAEGHLGRLPRERRSLEIRWEGEHLAQSQCAEDVATCNARRAGADSGSRQGTQGQGTLPSCPCSSDLWHKKGIRRCHGNTWKS